MIHLFLTKLEKLQQRFLYWRNFTQFRQFVEKPKSKRKKKKGSAKSPLFLRFLRFLQLASNSNKFLLFSLTCSQSWLSLLLWIASVCRWMSNKPFLSVNQTCCCCCSCSCSCFQSQARVLLFSILSSWWTGDHPEEDE